MFARHLYSNLLRLLKPAYVLRLWLRGRAEPLYRHAIGERLGAYQGAAQAGALWVHAVSLGETRAAAALVDALRLRHPQLRLLLTHSTATGREAGKALLREGDVQAWLPYDTPGVVDRFFKQFKPVAGVLMETEIWPNLLHAAHAAGVPMVLANARLSAKSHRQGQRLSSVMYPAAATLRMALAQTEDDATRLRDSGVREVVVCGNLKFDMTPDPALIARGRAWRARLGRPVVMAAATREGEEALLLAAWAALPSAQRPLLLIVPRHPQRFDEVAALVAAQGLSVARRSSWQAEPGEGAWPADVWLGDSMGEMPLYYGMSDVALLGGSFAPLGGQNLIEAAACGCPVVMGPHTFNFAEAATLSLAAGASRRVADMGEGVAQAVAMAGDAGRGQSAERAVAFATQHRGAAERMAEKISALLPDSASVTSPAAG
ncbi:3-deoxy-D-manno-octulosonic acid transferase [Piscinibacter gummiphilus]|uniref:3-deoxy-D-manno-octulosonic acid transferase n=1 Tax=Piscinibacter gummiphilus TaxID=946333 RepID=A0ABZ0D6F2_9BURK|nr:3-deoxy-D-manno-octulosonic acid transferase [Piscinibacter gummiphilus]WOB10259.1 3-deoxy-D-manno-octulosonic acid transferase [Piscinibacter gummiphilus]